MYVRHTSKRLIRFLKPYGQRAQNTVRELEISKRTRIVQWRTKRGWEDRRRCSGKSRGLPAATSPKQPSAVQASVCFSTQSTAQTSTHAVVWCLTSSVLLAASLERRLRPTFNHRGCRINLARPLVPRAQRPTADLEQLPRCSLRSLRVFRDFFRLSRLVSALRTRDSF